MDPDTLYDELKRALVELNSVPFGSDACEQAIDTVTTKFYTLDHWLQTDGFLPSVWEDAGRPPTDAQKLAKQISDEFPDRVVQPIKKYRDVLGARENRTVDLKEARDAIYRARDWF